MVVSLGDQSWSERFRASVNVDDEDLLHPQSVILLD